MRIRNLRDVGVNIWLLMENKMETDSNSNNRNNSNSNSNIQV